ncbi:argininosuccinate synthase domain-containing protein, partial [Acinetobacter baumannii]
VYEGRYLLGTSIARPVLAKAQVEAALASGADALAPGCTGTGNDQVRFESAYAALAPRLRVIAPWREWSLRSREELLNYLAAKKVPVAVS